MKKNEWEPNLKQREFLSIPPSIREAFYGGGAGSGKSMVLLMYGIVHRWHEHPKFKQVFVRRTYPELRNEIVPRSREIYTKFGATFNKTEMCWTFPSGALIFLGHCENETDVTQYDSMEINLFTPDELTSFTEYQYLYIGFTRVRSSDNALPAIIRGAGMPGGIGHTWVRNRFVKPVPKGGVVIVGKGGNKRVYIHSTLEDNKENIDSTYAQSLEALPEAEKKAKKYGDWDSYSGQVFDEFREFRYPDEPDNALHVIEPFDIPEWWPKIVIGDWGYTAYTWVGFAAISPNKRIYIYRELSWLKTKIAEWAPYVKQYIDAEKPRLVKFCKSAGQDRGQEHTIHQQLESELGVSIDLTENAPGSRIAGKILIHEYLRWRTKYAPATERATYSEEHAMWLLRNRGMNEYKSYLASLEAPEEETNIPRLQIFKGACPMLIDAIKACSYDKPKANKPAEDIAEFFGDDPIDGLRYLVDAAESFFDDANQEFKRAQHQQALVQQLQQNKDWTAFYRNAQRLESEDYIQPCARYHRR
jgi:Terminase large subunit, T4likevirus-type, N-terminal